MSINTELKNIENVKKYIKNPDNAVRISVMSDNGSILIYWVNTNSNVIECLNKEEKFYKNKLRKRKLKKINKNIDGISE